MRSCLRGQVGKQKQKLTEFRKKTNRTKRSHSFAYTYLHKEKKEKRANEQKSFRRDKIAYKTSSRSRSKGFFFLCIKLTLAHNKVNIKIMHFLWGCYYRRAFRRCFLPGKFIHSPTYSMNSYHISSGSTSKRVLFIQNMLLREFNSISGKLCGGNISKHQASHGNPM